MPHTKAVFFDLDETLIVHTHDFRVITHDTFSTFADDLGDVEEDDFMRAFRIRANDMWYMMIDGVMPGEVARPYMFINTLRALDANEKLAEPMLAEFERRILEATVLAADTLSVLDDLRGKGCSLGIVTNGYTIMQMRKIEHHGLRERVDFVLVSEAARSHKPDSRIFQQALEHSGSEAHEAMFVGDNLNTDIEGALRVGIPAVLCDRSGAGRRKLEEGNGLPTPDHIVAELGEVLTLSTFAGSST